MNSRGWRIRGSVILLTLGGVLALRAASADDAAGTGSKPLAVEELSSGGVEVSLLELKRSSGDKVTAKWLYKNTAPRTPSRR